MILFPKDPPYVLTEDGLPEELAALFNEMYAYVGTRVNDNSREHMVKALNDLLSIFEQAGLKGIGRVYLARMMDRLIVATMLYASTRNDVSKNMDLVEALLHPETC